MEKIDQGWTDFAFIGRPVHHLKKCFRVDELGRKRCKKVHDWNPTPRVEKKSLSVGSRRELSSDIFA
ncbi:unnamed protein product [Dovyalis caffra]|uniref:Uncharacterized protein n=1 Tax=Dovyalis caffra TaxID=77055 RepID=A0AAV1RFE9_9ROSI|nr:unnamed protein product [Dovyalis caffra]